MAYPGKQDIEDFYLASTNFTLALSLCVCVCVQAARLGAPLAPPLMATHPSLPPGPTPSMPMPALPVAAMPQPVETMPQPVSVVGKLLVKGKFDFKSVS